MDFNITEDQQRWRDLAKGFVEKHINLYGNYNELIKENEELKNNISKGVRI